MTKSVDELDGVDLDLSAARAEGYPAEIREGSLFFHGSWNRFVCFNPSDDWRFGGPIIERECILIGPGYYDKWRAQVNEGRTVGGRIIASESGPTPLIAAMRAFVKSKKETP